jgi:ElaB/YqjD/DUF883 family membrane-anchored ribosome-binding protein
MSDATIQDSGEKAQSAAEVRQSLVEGFHELEDRYRDVRDQAYALNRRAMKVVDEHPVACVVGAFAVGYVIGKLAKRRMLI